MKVGIHSSDDSHIYGFYSKIDGLVKAGKQKGFDYSRCDFYDPIPYDVVINWEPFSQIKKGKKLTIAWVWDTHRISLRGEVGGDRSKNFDILFRAHATHYHSEDIDPRQYPTYWMPPAVDEEVFKRDINIIPKHDIVFVGNTRYMPEFQILKRNFNMEEIWGGLTYQQYIKAFNEARLVLNVPIGHETNKRVMEAMAVGPALMSWGSDYALLATPDKDFLCYESIHKGEDEKDFEKRLVEKVKYYLDRPNLLYDIWLSGRETVEERFTFKKQIERIETIIRNHL